MLPATANWADEVQQQANDMEVDDDVLSISCETTDLLDEPEPTTSTSTATSTIQFELPAYIEQRNGGPRGGNRPFTSQRGRGRGGVSRGRGRSFTLADALPQQLRRPQTGHRGGAGSYQQVNRNKMAAQPKNTGQRLSLHQQYQQQQQQQQQPRQAPAPPMPRRDVFYVLLATYSDPMIVYKQAKVSSEESTRLAKKSFCGLTLVRVKSEAAKRYVECEGVCMRPQWKTLDKEAFQRCSSWLIFRDKFYNYRNFTGIRHMLEKRTEGSGYQSIVWQSDNGGVERAVQKMPEPFDATIVSNFSYEFLRDLASEEQFIADDDVGFECANMPTLERYRSFYESATNFISQERFPVRIYHRLPAHMNWLVDDMSVYLRAAAEQKMRVSEQRGGPVRGRVPSVDFALLQTPRATETHISYHCIQRPNHNCITCEICLFEQYLPQLLQSVSNFH